jgi:hypothetical protein
MVQRGPLCYQPRSEIGGGLRSGVPTLPCSATTAAFPRIHQNIKRLTPKTPPVLSGTVAVQFAANQNPARRPGRPTVSASPKICPEIINFGGVGPPLAAVKEQPRSPALPFTLHWDTFRSGGGPRPPLFPRRARAAFQEGAVACLGRAWTTVVTISGRACSGARAACRSTVTRRAFNPWAPCKSSNSTSSVSALSMPAVWR